MDIAKHNLRGSCSLLKFNSVTGHEENAGDEGIFPLGTSSEDGGLYDMSEHLLDA